MKQHLFQRIAHQLEAQWRKDPPQNLPSIYQLSLQFGISSRTMWKAIHVLIDRGIVSASPGRKIALTDNVYEKSGAKRVLPENTETRLYEKLKRRILDGEYKARERLPKVGYFTLTEHV